MRVTEHRDPQSLESVVSVHVADQDARMVGERIVQQAIALAAEHLAAIFVEQHQQAILAKMTPEAVANLAVAAAGASVRETLEKKLPDKVVEVVRTEVYQRGIFGGLRRL